jgi:hypothetical protein
MREIRLSGSVRGAGREVRPYRDPLIPMRSSVPFGMLSWGWITGLAQTARPLPKERPLLLFTRRLRLTRRLRFL